MAVSLLAAGAICRGGGRSQSSRGAHCVAVRREVCSAGKRPGLQRDRPGAGCCGHSGVAVAIGDQGSPVLRRTDVSMASSQRPSNVRQSRLWARQASISYGRSALGRSPLCSWTGANHCCHASAGNLDGSKGSQSSDQVEDHTVDQLPVSGSTLRLALAVSCVCSASFLFGYHSGVMNLPLASMSSDLGLDLASKSVCVSGLVAGGAVGALGCAPLSDRYGRKAALVAANLPMVIGSLLCATSTGAAALCVGRILCGVGVGAASVVAPALVAELSPAKSRGFLSSLTRLAYVVGVLASYVIAGAMQDGSVGWWRNVFTASVLPCLVLSLGLLSGAAPESPSWLARHGKGRQAVMVLVDIQGMRPAAAEQWVQAEQSLAAYTSAADGIKTNSKESWLDLLLPQHRKSLQICSGLAVLQALSGSNAVIYFAAMMFQSSGISQLSGSVLVGLFNLAGTLLALRLTDSMGRRTLLLASFGGMAACMAALAVVQHPAVVALYPGMSSYAATAAIPAFIFAFACGVGPLPYLLYSEVFAAQVRGKGTALCGALNWSAVLLLAVTFLPLYTQLGAFATFLLYAAVNTIAVAFVHRFVFETKGRSLQEIERRLMSAQRSP